MSLNSHAAKRLRTLYRLTLGRQWSEATRRPVGQASNGFEPLEPRLLLSVSPELTEPDAVTFLGDAAADKLYLRVSDGLLEYSETGEVGSYSADLDPVTEGEQRLQVGAETAIVADLGTGDDALFVDVSLCEALEAGGTVTFHGADGDDTLWGPAVDSTWEIAAADAGTLNAQIAFDGVENLTGGGWIDVFVFADGAGITGALEAGDWEDTLDVLDYSEYDSAIVVDLGSGAATGTGGASGFEEVVGGSGSDTLVGPAADTTWHVTGDDEGAIHGVVGFRGIENLAGTADNRDGFIIEAEGSISGSIAGGAGGGDGLVIEDPGEDGPFTVVSPDTSGAGTVSLYGRTIAYSGMEPIVDASAADAVVVHGSAYDDDFVLEDADAGSAGAMQVRSTTGDFYDAATESFVGAIAFANPATSLSFRFGAGEDTLMLGAFDPDFAAAVDVEGGGGFDTLAGGDGDNDWQITADNAGTLNGLAFASIENLAGGAGEDAFHFVEGAGVDGVVDGGTAGLDTLDYSAATSDVTVLLGVDVDRIDLVLGGSGSDTLVGLPDDATWTIDSMGGGEVVTKDDEGQVVAAVEFSDFENLAGRVGDDRFVFADGMGVGGTIDGGGGTNSLDYSLYSSANSVMVNLSSGGATGASGVLNIQSVLGGAGDDDTLVGPDANTTWSITGAGSGDVGGVDFEGFENLTGAADSEDGFILYAGGSLAGTVDGGAGGPDALAVEDPENAGSFAVIQPDGTGGGTLAVVDVFAGDARTIAYAGMEQSYSVDTTDPDHVAITRSFLAEELVLEAGPEAGQLQLRQDAGAGQPVRLWDVQTAQFVSATQVFDIPLGSVTIDLGGGDDALALGLVSMAAPSSPGAPGGDLIISMRGSFAFTENVTTYGGKIEVTADSVTVNSGVILSTRQAVGDQETALSIGDSGNLTLDAPTITIGSGAKLLTFDDRPPETDALGIPAAIDEASSPQEKWASGRSYSNVPTTSSGSGSGMTVDVVTDADGSPTVRLRTRGTGYAVGEVITIDDPNGVGDPVTVRVTDLLARGGDIALQAVRRVHTRVWDKEVATAGVTVTGASLKGRDIVITAEADGDGLFDGDESRGVAFCEGILDFLSGLSPLVGVSIAEATAGVTIGANTSITADGSVLVDASAVSQANLLTLGIAGGIAYGRAKADGTVAVEQGVSIDAGRDVRLGSRTDNAVDVKAMTSLISAIPFHVSVAITQAESHARTTVAHGAVITADGDVDLMSHALKDLRTTAIGGGTYDWIGAGIVVALSEATTEATVHGDVTAPNGDVSVVAQTVSTRNVTKAQSIVGDTFFAPVTNALMGSKAGKALSSKGKSAWYSVKNFAADMCRQLCKKEKTQGRARSNAVTSMPQADSQKFSDLGVSAAVAIEVHESTATVTIGGTAVVDAGGDVAVRAVVIDRPDITAASETSAGTDIDRKAKVDKQTSGSLAVLVGDYTNESSAVIGPGATVDAGGDVLVSADTLIPYETHWQNIAGNADGLGKIGSSLVAPNLGVCGFVTSWAVSAAEGGKAGLAGSVSIFMVDNAATARIDEGASINQHAGAASPGDVTVQARTDVEAAHLVGLFKPILSSVKVWDTADWKSGRWGLRGGKAGIGGSFGGIFYDNTTTAAIESGAMVDAADLLVDARTITKDVLLGLAGGKADKVAISGVATVMDLSNHTLAKIDNGATVAAGGSVDVTAADDIVNVNVVGGIVMGRSLGVGLTAGVNLIDRDTKALVGNQQAVLGRGESAPNTGVHDADNTIDLGYAHGLATGDAVVYGNGGGGSLGGLMDAGTYYVRVLNPTTVRLARSSREAQDDPATLFAPTDVDDTEGVETIDLGYVHGFQTGDAVVYRHGGGKSIGGLTDGQTYHVIRVSDTEVQLAASLDDAQAETPLPVDLDLVQGGSGAAHSLRVDLDPLVGSGSSHSLGVGFDPSTAVDADAGSIDLGYAHGLATGQEVVYSHGGGESIGGLANKNTYYAIMVDPTTVRLAESRREALEGVPVELDASAATGAAHTVGAKFRAIPLVDGQTNTIRFDGAHGLRDGQEVVYETGGGGHIGGLVDGDAYYVNRIDATTIKLARSKAEAAEDAATLFGPDDVDDTAGAETIDLGYAHGFQVGDTVVYANGGGEDIGGLRDGQSYHMVWASGGGEQLKLSQTPGGDVIDLDASQGSGTAHSLRLSLNPSVATGTGHALRTPDHVIGSLHSVGKTTVKATNTGVIVTPTLAAAITSDMPSTSAGANAKEAAGGGGKYGIAVSGSVSANTVSDITEAYIADSVVTGAGGLEVTADASTLIVAVSGAGALSTNLRGSFGLAGAVTVNLVDNDTLAYIHDSVLEDVGDLTVRAETSGRIIGIAAGLSGSLRGVGIAGSVAVNLIGPVSAGTAAYIDGSDIGGVANANITAANAPSIITVAGALAYGGKAGVGAGVAVNVIDADAQAYVAGSDLAATGQILLRAENYPEIVSVAAAIGIAKETMAAAVSVSVNQTFNDTLAYIRGKRTTDGVSTGGGIQITATDQDLAETKGTNITAIAGGVAIAAGIGSGVQGKGFGVTVGAAIAVNSIGNTIGASIVNGAAVSSGGDIVLSATSTATIYTLTIAGAGTHSSSRAGSLAFAGAGAGSGNTVRNAVTATVGSGSSVTTTGSGAVRLEAKDTSEITADAGGVGIAVARGQGGGVGLAFGISVAINEIDNDVLAVVDNATIHSAGSVELAAISSATIDALTIAGSVAAAGGKGGGFSFSGAGTGSGNTVTKLVEAAIRSGSSVTTTGTGEVTRDVTLTAADSSTIVADAGGVAIAIAGGQGGGVSVSAGVSVAINDIANTIRASIDGATVTSAGDVVLSATSTAVIDALTIAGGGSFAGGKGGGVAISGAGSGSGNTIDNTVEATICSGSTVETPGGGAVKLTAVDNSTITADAGGVGVAIAGGQGGGVSVSVGVSVADNDIGNDVQAVVDAATIVSGGEVELAATSTATINAVTFGGAVAIAGGAGGGISGAGAGAHAINEIRNTVKALVQDSSDITTHDSGSLILRAEDTPTITADAIGGSVAIAAGAGGAGAIAIGAAVATNDIDNIVSAAIDGSTVSSAAGVHLTAVSTSEIDAVSVAVSISAAVAPASLSFSGAGASSTNTTTGEILTYIDNSTVTAAGSVTVSAEDDSTAVADVGSGALNVGLVGASVGVSLSDNTIHNTVKAYLDDAAVTADGDIGIRAESEGEIDALTVATSVALSAGGAGAGGDADASILTTVEAYAGPGVTLSAGGDIMIKAFSDYDADADSYGIAGGTAAVGASLASASANGSVTAHIDGSVTGGDLAVQAEAIRLADAQAFSLAGGVYAGSGSDADATASPAVSAYVGDGVHPVSIDVSGNVAVLSHSQAKATADAQGVQVSMTLGMGVSLADAQVCPVVSAYVAPGTTLTAGGDVTVMALHNFDATGGAPLAAMEARAEADSSGGSLTLQGNGSEATAIGSADLNTYVAQEPDIVPTAITAGGDFRLISKASNRAHASGTGTLVSLGLAAGASLADAQAKGSTKARFDAIGGSDNPSLTAQDVEILAETLDYAKAHTVAGAGALLASGVGADSSAVVSSITHAYVGAGAEIRAYHCFRLAAAETPEVIADSMGVSVGGIGLAVGVSLSDAQTRPEVRSYVAPDSIITVGIFATGEATFAFRSEANLTPTSDTRLDFVPGTVTEAEIGGTLTYQITGAHITRSEGSWLAEGFAPGQTIHVRGASANCGDYLVESVTDSTLALADGQQLVDETAAPSASVPISGNLTDTISRDGGDWRADGFWEGDSVRIAGSQHNDGVYRIGSISADGATLTLTTDDALVEETALGLDVSVAPDLSMSGNPQLVFTTEAYLLGGANLTFDQNTITRDTGNWASDGFLPGHRIQVVGSAENDGEYDVEGVAGDTLTLAPGTTLVPEQDAIPVIRQELPDTIRRDSGNWVDDGFQPGQRIRIANSLLNDGTYRILSISADGAVLTLDPDADGDGSADGTNQLTNSADTDVTITAIGEELGGLAGDLTIVAVQSLPASGVSADAQGSASSGALLLSGAGTDNQAINNSTVHAYVGAGTALRFTGTADVNAGTFATQRTTSDAVSVGALAGGASLADADSTSNTQAYLGPFVSVTGGDLRVIAAGADDSEADAEVGFGGVLAGGDAEASTDLDSTAKAFLQTAPTGVVQAFSGTGAPNTTDTMTVRTADVEAAGVRMGLPSLDGLIGRRLEVTQGQGTGRSWTITRVTVGEGTTDLELLNRRGSDASQPLPDNESAFEIDGDQPLPLSLRSLEVRADHTARFNSLATSKHGQLAGVSMSEASNTVASGVEASLGDGLVVHAGDITVAAASRTEKPLLPGGLANLRGASGGLLDLPVSNTSSTTFTNDTRVNVGDGVQLIAASGDREKPGRISLLASNDMEAWDYVLLDSGGAVAVPIAFSLIDGTGDTVDATGNVIEGRGNDAVVEVGRQAVLRSDGDIDLSARTDAQMSSETQISTYGLAGAGWGGSGALLDVDNLVTVQDGATLDAGRYLYLLAGTDHTGRVNRFDLDARTDLWNNTAYPLGPLGGLSIPGLGAALIHLIITNAAEAAGVDVPAEANLDLLNRVTVAPNVEMTSVADAYLYAETGDLEVTGEGVGKDLYSEVLGPLTGGALELHGGLSITETESGVQMDGSLEVGIRNQQRLTLEEDPDSPPEDPRVIATQQDEGVTYTVRQESVTANLEAALEQAQRLRAQYDDLDPGNLTPEEAAFDTEIARLEAQIAAFGFSTSEEADGVAQTVIETDNLMQFIVVDPVFAQSANVNVRGGYLIGEGALKARGETEIAIVNETRHYLRVGDLTIPDVAGGQIRFNEFEIADLADLGGRNQGVPAGATVSLAIDPGTASQPMILVANTDPLADPAPDLQVVGAIRNVGGRVELRSEDGITVRGTIQAGELDLLAKGDFVLSYGDEAVNAGVRPQRAYATVVALFEAFRISKSDYAVNLFAGFEDMARQYMAAQAEAGGLISGGNAFISARCFNINGKIQSGLAEQTLILPASLDGTIAALKAEYDGRVSAGENPDPLLPLNDELAPTSSGQYSHIDAFYNAVEDRIELAPIAVRGGHIELVGEIISTGNGRIEVRSGYGTIDVTNATSYDLLVREVDVGSDSEGQLVITDLAASRLNAGENADGGTAALRTVFTGDGTSVQVEDNSPDLEPGTITGEIVQYAPVSDVRYEWVRGQAYTLQKKTTYRSSSWLGIDALAADPSNIHKTDVFFKDLNGDGQPDVTPLQVGEYTQVDPSITADYDYVFTQVTTDAETQVSERSWSRRSGFLGLGRTYYREVTYETGKKEFHRHSLKADYPIDIEFIGAAEGQIRIRSAASLLLDGPIRNANGSTDLEAGWDANPADGQAPDAAAGIRMISDTARIKGKQVSLRARAGIGADAAVELDLQSGGLLSATSDAGDIRVVEVDGELPVAQATTHGAGRVVLDAEGDLRAYDAESLIRGNKVELTSRSGGIGDESRWLSVDSAIDIANAEDAGLEVLAIGDIYVQEAAGDLYVIRAESVDSQGDPTGDVSLWAPDGSIRDYLAAEELDQDTFDKLLALADEVGLRGSAAQERAEANVAAFKATKEAEYHSYWGQRNRQRIVVEASEDLTFSLHAASNSITRSAGTWEADGFTADHRTIYITGSSGGNDGAYDVDHVDGETIHLSGATPLTADEINADEPLKVIGEVPASLVTIELTDAQEAYLREELGFDDDAVLAYVTNLTEQYRYLNSVYGGEGDFEDVDWAYSPTPEEQAALQRGAEWDDDALTLGISPALFKTTTTVVDEEQPNVRAVNVHLQTAAGVGAYDSSLAVDLSEGFAALSDQEKVALAAAERDDVTYFDDDAPLMSGSPTLDFSAADRTITRDGGSWRADGFAARRRIWVEGASQNTGRAFLVASVGKTVLVLDGTETLVEEAGVTGVAVGQFGQELEKLTSAAVSDTPTLTFDAAGRTIHRDDGSWEADGFVVGKPIWVVGSSSNNGQAFLVEAVTESTLTVSAATAPLQDEVVSGAKVGQVLVSRMTIDQRVDVDVEAAGRITIDADTRVFLGSGVDLNLNTLRSGEQIILRAGEGILNAADAGVVNVETLGPRGDLIVEAPDGIGTHVDASGSPQIRPIVVQLDDEAVLSARTDGDVHIKEIGHLRVGDVYVPTGLVSFQATGSLYDGLANDEVNIESQSLHLEAAGGIGTAEDFLDVDQGVLGGGGSAGRVDARAAGNVYLRDPVGDLNVGEVKSTGGDVSLAAGVSLVDADGENFLPDVIGNCITLRAEHGSIGQPFAGDLDLDTQYSGWGGLTAGSGLSTYLFEVAGDLSLMEVVAASGESFIYSSGDITDGLAGPESTAGGDGQFNVDAENAVFTAGGDVGAPNAPVVVRAAHLEGTASGNVHVESAGDVTVGDATTAKDGIRAGRSVWLTAEGTVTFAEPLIAKGYITVTAADSTEPSDQRDLVVQTGAVIQSTAAAGLVTLQAGDDFYMAPGGRIEAGQAVVIRGDYGSLDPGVGSTIDVDGSIYAPIAWNHGGEDDDFIDLRDADPDHTALHADGGPGEDVIEGSSGSDVLRGGDGNDVVHGNGGIDQLHGDDGEDRLYGDAGDASGATAGQRLWGGEGTDHLYAWASGMANDAGATGDELHGGPGEDWLYGNLRNDVLFGDGGKDFLSGDALVGPDYAENASPAFGEGSDDVLYGGPGADQLYGGGGDDELWGGGDSDWLEGQNGKDALYGGSGIDMLILDVDPRYASSEDRFDGHYGNLAQADVADDHATDILLVEGTDANDNIRLSEKPDEQPRQLSVEYNGRDILADWRAGDETPMIEEFRVSGLAGDDLLEFADDDGALDLSALAGRVGDWVGVLDGGPGNDVLKGSPGRDRIDGGFGSDTLYGLGGDDRLWGDQGPGHGSSDDHDVLYAGAGNDDLIGGQGTNEMYAWSRDPALGEQFGVFVDAAGQRFDNGGDGAYTLEDTGLNRVLGSRNADDLYGGTVLDFLYGNGGDDQLFNRDGTAFEDMDGGVAGDEWKTYAKSTGTVWYVGGSGLDDVISLDYVTEPGLLAEHHLVTRLTNNQGVYTFAAQVRLDFLATDAQGNYIWSSEDVLLDVERLRDGTGEDAGNLTRVRRDLVAELLPPEGNFEAIIIDALGGNDRITIGPTVQKTVWIDSGPGDDDVRIASGEALLPDDTEQEIRNDDRADAHALAGPAILLASGAPAVLAIMDDGESSFTLAVNGGPAVEVTLHHAQTEDNTELADLVADLNVALDAAGLGAVVVARQIDGRLALATTTAGTAVSLALVEADSEIVDSLGFAEGAEARGALEISCSTAFTGLTIDSPSDEDWYALRLADVPAEGAAIALSSLSAADGLEMALFAEGDDTPLATGDAATAMNIGALNPPLEVGTPYLLRVRSANEAPTRYSLTLDLDDGAQPVPVAMATSPQANRRDVLLGGEGSDRLVGGGGEDWIFGGPGNDVLTGGADRLASDLLAGGPGNDRFQIIPDALPVLAGTNNTYVPTASDRILGGEGTDEVIFLGGDTDAAGRPVNDHVAIRYNIVLHRYELGALVWDTANQQFLVDEATGLDELHLAFYQAREVEKAVFDMRAGDDVVRGDAGYTFPGRQSEWGIDPGDAQQRGAICSLEIHGGAGNDQLYGGAYDDNLYGEAGLDTLVGGGGNDVLEGGDLHDFLAGDEAVAPDRYEWVWRHGAYARNDFPDETDGAMLPSFTRETLVGGLTMDLDDKVDSYIVPAHSCPRQS